MTPVESPNIKPDNDPPCPQCGSTHTNSPYWAGTYRGCYDCGCSWVLSTEEPITASLADKAEITRLHSQLETITKGSFDGMQALAKDMAELRAENQRLREVLKQIPFAHTKNCSFDPYPNGDACDCGLAERVKMIQTALSDSTPSEQREEKP